MEEADIPSMDALVSSQAELKKMVKIGEGTYGEAFKFNKWVWPLRALIVCTLYKTPYLNKHLNKYTNHS